MSSGRLCQRVGCNDIDTKPMKIAGLGGKAYDLWLCPKHRDDMKDVKLQKTPKPDPNTIMALNECMMGIYHCFGITFTRHLTIDDKPYDKVSWRAFRYHNRRLKKKGNWYFDEWLVDLLKQGAHLFGHYLKHLEVMMPRVPLPLILLIPAQYGDKPDKYNEAFCLMIAPKVPNDDLWNLHVKRQHEWTENQ